MRSEVKIIIFWLIVGLMVWALKKAPTSVAAKMAFSWNGPFPQEGELKSSYYRRKTLFALGWFVQIIFVALLLFIVTWIFPAIVQAETFLFVACFALTIGLGMAALGALLAFLTYLKAKVIGPNNTFTFIFEEDNHENEEDVS
ncbi:hypothetical protein ACO0K3_09825 [Undibacterium sp. Rencai35W]|uniref:hypothetical protein n=1 Tax=Undibacterium sp. Rencai35W TaxID=3413046 RepID=UPI003BF158AB